MLQRIKKLDGVIVLVLGLLMAVSIFSIYSVTLGTDKDGYHLRMLTYYGVGFPALAAVALVNYKWLLKYALYVYIAGLGVLAFVGAFGEDINGSKGWIKLPGGLTFQPAELFKLILILFLASVIVRKRGRVLAFWRDIVPLTLMTLLPFGIVIVLNDLGNALSYLVILIGLLWIGNVRFTHALIGLLLVGGLAGGGIYTYIHQHDASVDFIKNTLGRDHLVNRFDPWLVPDLASRDASYHTKNAKLAIASGGMTGEGYMQGSSVQSNRVPYTYSDAIFVQVAEEYGFVGSAGLLLLFFILIHRMILIALESRDRAGPLLIVGIVAMLLYQILENIGAFIGLMPLTGITLPFISFGGTSLVINMASMGLVLSVQMYGGEVEEEIPTLSSTVSHPSSTARILH